MAVKSMERKTLPGNLGTLSRRGILAVIFELPTQIYIAFTGVANFDGLSHLSQQHAGLQCAHSFNHDRKNHTKGKVLKLSLALKST